MPIPQSELQGLFPRFAAPLITGEAAKRFDEAVAKQLAQTFWHMMIQGPMSEAYLWNSFGESFTPDDVAMLRRCFEEEMKPSLSLTQLTGLGEWYLKGEEGTFAVGDHVRVRHGTVNPDYSDLPLGGWCGTITELGDEGYCTHGYQDYVKAMANPRHKRHKEFLQWNGPFDPEKFDAQAATKEMRKGVFDWRNKAGI